MSESLYNFDFDGTYVVYYLDEPDAALQRWFKNHCRNRWAFFPSDNEWMTIEEVTFPIRLGKRTQRYWRIVIGADHHEQTREYLTEVGAPPPPTFFRAVLKKFIPPPVLTDREKAAEALRWLVRRSRWELEDKERAARIALEPPAPPPAPRYRRNS